MNRNDEAKINVKTQNRNYVLMFLDTVLFINAMTFVSVNTVITYFLSSLGASTLEISLASALVSICAVVTQPLFVKRAMESTDKTKTLSKILLIQRLVFLIVLMMIPVFSKSNPKLMVVIFLIGWGGFNLFTGSYSPFYSSILNKMIPHHQRGRLLGAAGAMGNLIALGAAALIGVLLKVAAYPYNYMIILLLGIFLLLVDALDFWLMKEIPDKITEKYSGYFDHIKNIPVNLKNNPKVKSTIVGNSFIAMSNIALGYYTLFAIRTYHANAAQIALFTALGVGANTIGSIVLGFLADRFGHKLILMMAGSFNLAAGLVMLSVHNILGVYVAFALSMLCSSGFNLSSGIMIMYNSDPDRIPVFTSANSMITMGLYSIFMVLSSSVIDHFSFMPVFGIVGLCGFAAVIVFGFIKIGGKTVSKNIKAEL